MSYKATRVINNSSSAVSATKVGIVFPGYGYERVSYALPVQEFEFKRVRSIPIHRIFKNNFYQNTPIILPCNVSFLHTWNALPICSNPFFVSFENELPRYFGNVHKWQKSIAFSILKSQRCKGILALSDTAAKLARENMNSCGYPEIASKINVFRGGVVINDESFKLRRRADETIRLIIVAGDIFPKGFVPAFYALEELVNTGLKIELMVIGKFKEGGYALKEHSPNPYEWNNKLQNISWVTHYEQLPNKMVLENMAKHDLLISPSYDETLGWSVIEAGLLGVPAITSNVFALPELVKHNESGYVINLKLGKQRRWQGIWENGIVLKNEIDEANKLIYNGVLNAVRSIVEHPELLNQWSNNCRVHLNSLYNVDKAAKQLSAIYQKGLSESD